jgi:hypothetical protein
MPKRNRTDEGVGSNTERAIEESVGEPPNTSNPKLVSSAISKVMAQMGRKGGRKGGKRRLETMTSEERSQIALKAAQTRWAKKK